MNLENVPAPKKNENRIVRLPELKITKLDSLAETEIDEGRNTDEKSTIHADSRKFKADTVANARLTLETMNGQATTPENERKVREARATLGEAADDLPDDVKKDVETGQEKDSILNDQVADGRLNLNQVESRIVEFETHQRAELHHAIENRLSTKLIPALAGFGIKSLSDLQIALNCDSQTDLISTCEKILKAASPQTKRDFKTMDIRESIGNLNDLENILIAGFRLEKKDPDFKLEQFRIDPEAAVRMVRVEEEIEGSSDM